MLYQLAWNSILGDLNLHIFFIHYFECAVLFWLSAVLVWGWNLHWVYTLSITIARRIASYVMCDTYFTLDFPVYATSSMSCDHMCACLCCSYVLQPDTVMCHLTMWICSEKCVVRWFCHCTNIIECTYTNLDSIAYYTPRLYGIAYCS